MKFITSRALILGIQAVVSAVLAFFVVKIGILPTKYLMAAFAVLDIVIDGILKGLDAQVSVMAINVIVY